MPAAHRAVGRPLGPSEHWYWVADQISSINWFACTEVAGPLDASAVHASLEALQIRHPLLRVRIETDERGRRPRFVSGGTPGIPVRFADVAASDDVSWLDEAEREINTPIDGAKGPLMRVVVLRDGARGRTGILFTLSHVIADGFSGALLVEDFLRGAAASLPGGAEAGEASSPPPQEMQLRAVEDLLPPPHRGLRGMLRMGAMQLRSDGLRRLRRPQRLRPDRFVDFDRRRSRLIHREIEPEAYAELARHCAREGVTVHGALCAALSQAVAEHAGGRSAATRPVDIGSPISLRPHLAPAVGQEVGVFVSAVVTSQPIRAGFWERARDVNRQFDVALRRGDHLASMNILKLVGPVAADRSQRFLRLMERQGPGNVTLSNLGRLSIPDRIGPLSVRSVHFGASLSVTGYFLAMVSTSHERLRVNFTHVEDAVSRERALSMADRCMQELEAAASLP